MLLPGCNEDSAAAVAQRLCNSIAQQAVSVPVGEMNWFPGIEAGVRSLAFIETALANSNGNQKWSEIES